MKKTLLALLLLVYIVSFTLPAFAMKNEPDNFRGIPWGTPAPKDDRQGRNKWGLVWLPIDFLSQKAYARKGDELYINGAKVIYIHYFFQESLGFARVDIMFSGLENYELIRKACFFNWGKPDTVAQNLGRSNQKIIREVGKEDKSYGYETLQTFWLGEKVIIELAHNNFDAHVGTLEIYFKNYFKMVERDNAKYLQQQSGF